MIRFSVIFIGLEQGLPKSFAREIPANMRISSEIRNRN